MGGTHLQASKQWKQGKSKIGVEEGRLVLLGVSWSTFYLTGVRWPYW